MSEFEETESTQPPLGAHYVVYQVGPIDFWTGWSRWDWSQTPFGVRQTFEDAGREAGWEGDVREGWFAAPIADPETCSSLAVLAMKQDNNGTTYIYSPVQLPHLGHPGPAEIELAPRIVRRH